MDCCVGLYVHIPFCRRKCSYCDFVSVPGHEELWRPYLEVLLEEIAALPPRWPRTLYLGGGTPTLWPAAHLASLIAAAHAVGLPGDAEVTVEANPGTVDAAKLAALRAAGCNRLSLGVQSTFEEELRLLGRVHTFAQAQEAVRLARAAGFDNLSLDLIYGLPGQRLARWEADLDRALELGSEHLSLYCLSLEPGTLLEAAVRCGDLPCPDADLAADMYLASEDRLARAGYGHYEISNWARPAREPNPPASFAGGEGRARPPLASHNGGQGRDRLRGDQTTLRLSGKEPVPSSSECGGEAGEEGSPLLLTCKHNLIYWRNEPYVGLGAGAHSFLDGRRFARVDSPEAYVAATPEGRVVFSEGVDRSLEMAETAILGLRLVAGLERARFRSRFGEDPVESYREPIRWATDRGLLVYDQCSVRLTRRGRLLSNEVFERFLPD
ncbi:MAG: coproporphyrinogen III oxidase family protein [Anaerolineae bacterium]|nr:coproporphyrinogen III oxidase family protein [Anaerolineae bacterium]